MEFVVLPDRPDTSTLIDRLELPVAVSVLPHPSGRPWLIGDWTSQELVTARWGDRAVAILGLSDAETPNLQQILRDAEQLEDLDALARRHSGSFHMVASLSGRTRVQGSISTVRQVFHTVVSGTCVAGSSPVPLLGAAGATLDRDLVAAHLLLPVGRPWPLSRQTVWTGIGEVGVGHWLLLDRDGHGEERRWWTPPEPVVPLAAAAPRIRDALRTAVALRMSGDAPVSADLSGGLDSTSVCFFAAAQGDLITWHVTPLDGANEDTLWARLAAERIPEARHEVLPADREENWFDVPALATSSSVDLLGPPSWAGGRAHALDLSARVGATGARRHLVGLGGDELFGPSPHHLRSLWQRDRLRAMPTLNRRRLLNRWSAASMIRSVTSRESFPEAVSRAARCLTADLPGPRTLDLGWLAGLRMPAWAASDAVQAVRHLLQSASAEGADPLADDRAVHLMLASLHAEGSTMRHLNAAVTATGVGWEAPLLDDRVVEAALCVQVADRFGEAGSFKPVLAAAAGVVPPEILRRRDKGEFSAEMYHGLRRNQERLLELCRESQLAALGLVDAAGLRAAILDPGPTPEDLIPLEVTVGLEGWLRSPAVTAARSGGRAPAVPDIAGRQ